MEKLISSCKNCGSELKFDPIKQTLSCEYCETSYHLPKAKIDAVLVRGYSNAFHPNQFNKNLIAYKCDMCGHVYFSASQEKSSECNSCGSSSCSQIKSSGYCADGIIPFEITKLQAAEKFEKYLKSKPGIPKAFMAEAKNQNLTSIKVLVAQLCPNLHDPMDYSQPGFSVHGILQAGVVCHSLLQGLFLTRD